jgi:hypothetical protein
MHLELSDLMCHFFRHICWFGNRCLTSLGLASLSLLTFPAYAKYTDIFTQHQIDLKFNVNQPLVKMIDINGDAVKDIVYSDGDNLIRVLLATPGQKNTYAF